MAGEVVDMAAARARRHKPEAVVTSPADPRCFLFGTGVMSFPAPCEGWTHNFMAVPGPCNCGTYYFDGTSSLSSSDEAR